MRIRRTGTARVIYWDSCIFIAWIKGETVHGRDVTEGMNQLVDEVARGQAIIITSVMTKTEVLEGDLTPDQRKKFTAVFGNRNVVMLDLDSRVSDKAGAIRNFYKKPGSRTMAVADSVHLATAIHYNAHVFQTLDGSSKQKRKFDLLPLNGNVAGSRLRIEKPTFIPPPQPLQGPVKNIDGKQIEIEFPQGTQNEAGETKVITSPTKVPGSSQGSPPSEAGTKAGKR